MRQLKTQVCLQKGFQGHPAAWAPLLWGGGGREVSWRCSQSAWHRAPSASPGCLTWGLHAADGSVRAKQPCSHVACLGLLVAVALVALVELGSGVDTQGEPQEQRTGTNCSAKRSTGWGMKGLSTALLGGAGGRKAGCEQSL